ncbi:hypothetical protein Gpo141_00011810 [Globisporangium polare]
MAFERLSACVDELRAGASAADLQAQQRKLLKELFSIERRWTPELLVPSAATATTSGRRLSGGNGQLFALLLQTLLVYSGNHTGSSGGGASGTNTPMTMSLGSSAPSTSECILSLLCDLLVRAFDYSAVPLINEMLTAKHNTSIYVKAALVMVVSKLPLGDAIPFLTEIVAFANKTIKTADYFMKQCLIESVTRVLDNELPRVVALHSEALRIVNKTFQDKIPEVRLAAAGLLHILALHTSPGNSHSGSASGGGSGGSTGNGLGNSGNGSSSASGGSGGGGNSSNASSGGVTQEAIMYIAIKGMDDAAPEARRAYAAVVGVVLAKFATSTPENDLQQQQQQQSQTTDASASQDDDNAHRHAGDQENGSGNLSGSGGPKSKLAFKMPTVHLSGMSHINLPGSLSRRKAAAVNFSTVASIIGYLKENVTSRYLTSSNPNQSHGGILAAYSVALTSMFEHLPPDTISEQQFSEIIDATLGILDHPFALGDLTRARNAVCYVLRYGLYPCLTERQQEALLGSYLQKLKEEAATAGEGHHHKLLSILVEISHMLQAMGEACVSHANDGTATLQGLLSHEKQSVRFQASVALASLVTALPYKLKSVLSSCISGLRDTAEYLLQTGFPVDPALVAGAATAGDDQQNGESSNSRSLAHLYIIQGRSSAIAHILKAIKLQNDGGLSHTALTDILRLAEQLIESQYLEGCTDSVWLTCTRAGWTLVGSLVAVNDEHWIHTSIQKLLNLWLKSSVLHTRESSLELLRIEAAVIALNGFLSYCKDLTTKSDSVQMLAAYILNVFLSATQDRLSNPLKRRGQVARYRVITWIIKSFVLLPPIFSDSYIVLLDLIAEYTVAQSLTNLRQSSLVPATSTFLDNALSGVDDPLEMVSTTRLVAGDNPSVLYSRELNHILALLQHENALSDTELEVQYMDNFWGVVCEMNDVNDLYERGICSSFTYVRLVDASVFLFGRIFHFVPEELQLRCLQHYAGVLADGRVDCEVNVSSLLFAAIREAKHAHVDAPSPTAFWPQQMQTMLCEMISSENPKVRRSAGEALGMLASLISEPNCKALVQEIEKRLVAEKLPLANSISPFGGGSDADVSVLSAGAAFALACIKRVCGSRISIDTGLIFRFAGEISQPLRTWILHSWSIIVESVGSTGGDYEQYIKSTSSLIDAHLLAGFKYSKTNKRGLRWHISAKVAIGRVINGVVATLGPDLAGSGKRLREYYTIWGLLRQDGDLRVELEYLKFLEQVVVFAPTRFQHMDLMYILGVLSDAFILAPGGGGSGGQTGSTPQPSPSTSSARSSFGSVGEQHRQNVLIRVNGIARSILQQVGMSCIRTLVERDPSQIQRQSLQCLLFHALHVEYNGLTWRYLPGVHGMWDYLTFAFFVPSQTRSGAQEIRNTILALVDIDGANVQGHQLIVWSLFCRSIAVGESGASASGGSSEQLMMSPKGIEGIAGLSFSSSGGLAAADEGSGWGFPKSSGIDGSDKTLLASDATAAQLEVWRNTKRVVSELMAVLPPLSRQVRHFAIECVLRVFELTAASSQRDSTLHFDLIEARNHFLQQLGNERMAMASTTTPPDVKHEHARREDNFLCMYLDEFVTLACHAATASADGSELQMFQSVGLRLLNVLVHKFAAARDPEVHTGDAFLLDPYQAQMASAIRQALKQSKTPSTASSEFVDLYAPLLIEAHGICGGSISSRLVQDKIALGRILKMVVVEDFGHAQFIGDEVTRVTLSLANLSCIAQMLVASVSQALADQSAASGRRGGGDSVASSPLVKVFLTTFGANSSYLIDCWKDVTLSYGVLMRGSGQWPHIEDEKEFLPGGGATSSKVLKTLLPVPTSDSHSSSTSSAEKFREVFRQYWPNILSALVYAQAHLPTSFNGGTDMPSISSLLLAFSVFHLNTGVRDRQEDEQLIPVIQTVPLLLNSVEREEQQRGGQQQPSEFVVLYQSSVSALVNAALRSSGGGIRVEALKSLFSCLKRDTIAFCISQLTHQQGATEKLYALIGQAALCPAEVFRLMCDPSKVAHHSNAHFGEVVRYATAGIVLLHTTEKVRSQVVHAIGIVEPCYRSIQGRVETQSAVLALNRAVIESTVAFSNTLGLGPHVDSAQFEAIRSELRSSFSFFVRWLQEELVVARERSVVSGLDFVMKLLANYAVAYPPLFADDAASFHAATTKIAVDMLEVHRSDGEQRNSLFSARLLQGLVGIAKKLVDVQDVTTTRWYFAALGPSLVQLVEQWQSSNAVNSADAVSELEQTMELLQLLSAQLDEAFGAAFVRLVLPKIAAVLHAHASSEHSAQVAATIAKLLLAFAQTRPAAFKEVVVALGPTLRSVLELALRNALTGGGGASSQTAPAAPGRPLDLSRYG